MDVKFEKQQVNNLTILGTIREIIGPNGELGLNKVNFNNTTTKVFVDLIKPDGTDNPPSVRAFCSPAMSAIARSAEFGTTWQEKVNNFMSMEIIATQRTETTVDEETGEEIENLIDMLTIKSPVSANKVVAKPTSEGTWKPEPIELDNLVSLG